MAAAFDYTVDRMRAAGLPAWEIACFCLSSELVENWLSEPITPELIEAVDGHVELLALCLSGFELDERAPPPGLTPEQTRRWIQEGDWR